VAIRSLVCPKGEPVTEATPSAAATGADGDGVPVRTLGKTQRQHRIAGLLADHAVSSQSQLVDLLTAEGVAATQATVSRDLEDLGAIKVRVGGGETVYAIPELPVDHLHRVVGDWVVEVAKAANLVVLRTPPGTAHVVASALDRSGLPGVVGTVAGDDTIVVVVADGTDSADMAAQLSDMAGL
jgi:transcriptional regulator of arginine metabolism